jgi:DNA adenine methylase
MTWALSANDKRQGCNSRSSLASWIVSYDDHEFIANLYKDNPTKRYSFNHSAFSARQGKEILVFSPLLKQPNILEYLPTGFKTKRSGTKREIIYRP